jgi:hypothetical protein
MNERQLEQFNELKDRLQNSIGNYAYTDKYSVETKESKGEEYATAEVTITISNYDKEKRDYVDKDIIISFLLFEDRIEIVKGEDDYEQVDICNFEEEIWRKMFFEK